jgi:hypothetical protein
MADRWFTTRPVTFPAIQWTGANFADVSAFGAAHLGATCTQDGDNINVFRQGDGISFVVPLNGWLSSQTVYMAVPDDDFQRSYQELTGSDPRSFDITES